MYNKWVNRNKLQQKNLADENGAGEEKVLEEEDEETLADSETENCSDEASIETLEIERKNLATKTSFPISTNLEAWRSLQSYRFSMIKKNKTVNIFEMWPLYTHSEASCLVNI